MVLISKNELSKKNIHETRWISYGESDFIYKYSSQKSNKIITVDSITTMVNLVKAGVGIAIVPDHVVKKSDNLIVTEVPEFKTENIYVATLNYKHMPRYIFDFFNFVTQNY